MEAHKQLEILDADNIDFNGDLTDGASENERQSETEPENEPEPDSSREQEGEQQEEDQEQQDKTIEPNEMALDEPGFFYNLLHILDDLYVYGRTVIENNYFNLSDNVDFNLVYPNIYIGNYSTSTNLELLQGLGITHIITVLPTFNPPFPDKFTYHHVAAYDDESQNLESFFEKTNQFISDVLTQRGKLLIHCMVGRSRSVSVFMAFLIHVIQGRFSQSLVDTTSGNDVSNEIEYNKFIGKQNAVITDGVARVRYNNHQDNGAAVGKNNDEEISRIEYITPQLGNKYRSFMNYKKDTMIAEINKIVDLYKLGLSRPDCDSDKIYADLLEYVKKYRTIACPNAYFEKQLKILINNSDQS